MLKDQGRKEMFSGVAVIVTYMKDVWRDEKLLSTVAIIDRMWAEDPQWVAEYISSRKSGGVFGTGSSLPAISKSTRIYIAETSRCQKQNT
ncbi:hypothetical protein PC118_g15645 [Phytophthora cactorum]|nr:hypothetical protein PC113_g14256 [Phytophthora cactorum]KAG2919942.1 hypothetical protein PC117_g16650 [Phytophthora cactorum]KAG2972525.1 hypothetical protein PC118_g15645 [Phytophthora cactorum]KAG3001479.1 hypothetical protein PC119_g16693 [Phytophthora cactorum]KAG3010721.1 hypothetical protein PC120_g14893 [Phytophthora cactorum]